MEQKVMVGIPIRNDLESALEMFKSLINSTKAYDKIVFIIGEGTEQLVIDTILKLQQTFINIEVINLQSKTPLIAYNHLFNLAKERGMDLFLTQTDVIFPRLYKRDWLDIMKQYAQREEIGVITCINGTGISGPDYIDGFTWLGGWCTYYPLRTLEKVGGYDEDFPWGWGVDIEHTYRIFNVGLKIIKIDYWVHHHRENERLHDNDKDAEVQKQECARYFRKKWKLGEFKDA